MRHAYLHHIPLAQLVRTPTVEASVRVVACILGHDDVDGGAVGENKGPETEAVRTDGSEEDAGDRGSDHRACVCA